MKNRRESLNFALRALSAGYWYFRSPFYKWDTLSSFFVDSYIKSLFGNKVDIGKGGDLIRLCESKRQNLESRVLKTTMINMVLIVVLFLYAYDISIQATIAGIKFENIHRLRELILIVSSLLGFYNICLQVNHGLLSKISQQLALVYMKNPERGAYNFINKDHFEVTLEMDAYFLDPKNNKQSNASPGNLAKSILAIFALFFMLYLFVIMALALFVHVNVLLDIIHRPSFSPAISYLIAFTAAAFDLVCLLAFCLLCAVPTRHKDIALEERLVELYRADKSKAEAEVQRLIKSVTRDK